MSVPRRVAVLSFHTSPLAPLGGRETGGMNVYVRAVTTELARAGTLVDIFTRRIAATQPDVQVIAPGVRLIHITAGPQDRIEKEQLYPFINSFVEGVVAFSQAESFRYDLVHSHYWLAAEAGVALAAAWDVPHVAMFHTLAEVKLLARASECESEKRRESERRLVQEVDRIVAATEHEQRLLEQIYGVFRSRIEVVPLGVDRDRFRPREQAEARRTLSLDSDAQILLAVGRIEPLKGLDILIEALAEMTERTRLQLLIVGGDDRSEHEVARLHQVAQSAGVAGHIRFVGAVLHEDLNTYYNAADVVVVPSFYESFGLVAVEAMASGVPVVASRVGGLASTIIDGRCGYLIPWRCPGPFAEKLDLLLENRSLRDALGTAAAISMEHYEWFSVAQRLSAIYETLIREHIAEPALAGA